MRSAWFVVPCALLLSIACDPPRCGSDLRYDEELDRCVCDHEWNPDTGVCSVPDAAPDGCLAATEVCNGIDDDCDGDTDEAAATASCSTGEGIVAGACSAGECVIASCREGAGDCNREFEDGCEIELATARDHCGACGSACETNEICAEGSCSALPIHRALSTFPAMGEGSQINHIVTGTDGTVYVAGSFTGSIRLGTRTLTSRGGQDAFIASLAPAGAVRWVEQVGGASTVDEVRGLAIGADGRLFAVGRIREEIVIGTETLEGAADTDGFVIVLDALGLVVDHRVLGGPGYDKIDHVAVDEAGRIFVALAVDAAFEVEGVTLPPGEFVVALRDDLSLTWSRLVVGASSIWSLAAGAGHVLAVGHFTTSIDMGSGHLVTSRGEADAFFGQWSSEGVLEWLRSDGGPGHDYAFYGALLRDGSLSFVSGSVDTPESESTLWRIDETGTVVTRRVGADHPIYDLVSDAAGIYTTGGLVGSVALTAGGVASSTGGTDTLVVAWTADLEPVWWAQSAGAGDEVSSALATYGEDGLLVAGRSAGGARFGDASTPAGDAESAFLWSVQRR